MTLSCSHAAHGFQALLEKLPKAERVTILTWSLDTSPKSPLWDGLRKLPDNCHLTIITNIPSRFENYFGRDEKQQEARREQAKRSIDAYLDNLMPENFACSCEVYFSFQNHAKIIIVDDMAYVGSANFTQASASNFEAGVIITEKGELEELDAFVKKIRKSSLSLLKAGDVKEGRTVFNLALWSAEIVRSVREENGFMMSDDGEWIEDDRRNLRESVQISERLFDVFGECRTAAEELLKLCGGKHEILNKDALTEILDFVRYFQAQDYNESLPKPFNEGQESNRLAEELLNECSNDGKVDDVMKHPKYHERLELARRASEKELDAAVADALDDLVEHIEVTTGKLRSSFAAEDVSQKIDNTKKQ